ncbi:MULTISPECIES: sigma-70 family RNA polymerase sigma factor [Roseomonadaceae]|uniref:Sigma-70 family RNA polymerase sigma factor n=1 Tax=Falsiroseomonas oleicola TaxID=2801474 RepID=A0ABS6HAC9_9PROT|nr:sigma-70 family RNA polymerase sigma factor [Roseomonas oleicola]MBU8545671.1 sigma-70 family RNA polymerase sigma factor [Roseomonas oleicola]
MPNEFHGQVIALLPRLRVQALALTRNRAAADDLVQDAVANALAAQNSFTPGTNFPAWMHRILRNRFISTLRKQRETTDIEDVPASAFAVSATHEDRLILKELGNAVNRLPADQREALFMVVLQGMSYEDVAEATGCAVGTAKSRVFRARRQLQTWLTGEESAEATTPENRTGENRYTGRPAASGMRRMSGKSGVGEHHLLA